MTRKHPENIIADAGAGIRRVRYVVRYDDVLCCSNRDLSTDHAMNSHLTIDEYDAFEGWIELTVDRHVVLRVPRLPSGRYNCRGHLGINGPTPWYI